MKLFIVQHVKTGNYLPIEFNKGGTYWEGEAGKAPRVFHSLRAASAFVINWAFGQAYIGWEATGSWGEQECTGVEYKNVGRSRSDLKVVECELIPIPAGYEVVWDIKRRRAIGAEMTDKVDLLVWQWQHTIDMQSGEVRPRFPQGLTDDSHKQMRRIAEAYVKVWEEQK